MSGRLIAVVGPSGVGKDTVMEAMAAREGRLGLVRRVITRQRAAGGEVFDPVSPARFEAMRQDGGFALHWEAHGLFYGIPAGLRDDLTEGRDMLVNLSRGVLDQAQAQFAGLVVIALSAAPEVLAQRLVARGREDQADIARRLSRCDPSLGASLNVIHIDNSGALQDTVEAALNALYPVRG